MLARDHWSREIEVLEADGDAVRISQLLGAHEFPWDTVQALSFALFRTFAVPSIGRLLYDTGEFTGRVQKRYDDTALLLDHIVQFSLGDPRGRAAVRRINQMHGSYDISNDDLRYVLATFVVVPVRWINRFGYRSLTPHEQRAATNYYLELGRHMSIRDLPEDFAGFSELLDSYEAAHFAYDDGARAVADATLGLLTTFTPYRWGPKRLAVWFALGLMDDPLIDALGYRRPGRLQRRLVQGVLRTRARFLRFLPARREPKWASDFDSIRSYPDGFDVEELGTFPVRREPDSA